MAQDTWPRIAVFGAGAVGCYFGGMLARAGGPVTLIGRPSHVDAINRDGLYFESLHFQEHVRISATTDVAAVSRADIVLFCVKATDTEKAAKLMAPQGAVVVSLQNGLDNVERIRAATGIEALPAVVYVAAEMPAPGHLKHNGRGDLVVGDAQIAALFNRAGVPCRISQNIEADLWTKLIMNCSHNAISALTRSRYGRMAQNPWVSAVTRLAVEEAATVACAAGVLLNKKDLFAAQEKLATTLANAVSSTAQDISRGRRTEIDSLNGYVARRGRELGIPTPVNQTLHALVKLLEESAV